MDVPVDRLPVRPVAVLHEVVARDEVAPRRSVLAGDGKDEAGKDEAR